MKHLHYSLIGMFLFILFLENACTFDQVEMVTPSSHCDTVKVAYTLQVKSILDINCASSQCHSGKNEVPGDFSNYQQMRPYLVERFFKRFVIDYKDDPFIGMPPNWASIGPKDLTSEELEVVTCWIQQGYPEN